MKDQIISYRDMCDEENVQTLQRGMNYRLNPNYSVFLMSQRTNAPYVDAISKDGYTLVYEGHDLPKSSEYPNPKILDQPQYTKNGGTHQNGKFVLAVKDLKKGLRDAEIVRVYEKLFAGVWSDKGFFKLVDYKFVLDKSKTRKVFKFVLEETELDIKNGKLKETLKPRTRIIPSAVKKAVWERDGGRCVECGSKDELHFDHDIPYSKGGSSITVHNVKLLCARHNLSKSAKIQ